jgi:hypothetical protein
MRRKTQVAMVAIGDRAQQKLRVEATMLTKGENLGEVELPIPEPALAFNFVSGPRHW